MESGRKVPAARKKPHEYGLPYKIKVNAAGVAEKIYAEPNEMIVEVPESQVKLYDMEGNLLALG